MVYDNVDDPVTIRRLPPVDNAHVPIATRRTDWDGDVDELPVDVLDRDTAVEFLMAQARHDDRTAAERLADALGQLPLGSATFAFQSQNQITEEAEPSTIDAPFNFTDV
jgi:hypothetical protein